MNANELRIGNLVLSENQPHIVETIYGGALKLFVHTMDKETLLEVKLNQCPPIQLTEEWLLRLGFDTDESIIYAIGDLMLMRENGNEWSMGMFSGVIPSRLNGKTTSNPPIEYVHQLQNLYFALTGEELTVNQQEVANPNKVV